MNKSLSLELHVVSTFWSGSDTPGTFFYIYFAQLSYKLERPALENGHTLLQRTNIFSCKFSVKVSLMLDNPFLVPSRRKLNHISFCFIQISTKSPAKLLVPFSESTVFFWGQPRCFGPLGKFQHNIKLRRPVFPDYLFCVTMDFNIKWR